jgi:8-oxo-dGTP diphosphatase
MRYRLLKNVAAICFNLLNILLRGNLPPLACVCVIIKDDGHYLVIEQPGGQYAFPGGFMLWHEQPIQTARRETREETGLELDIDSFAGYQSYNSRSLCKISTITLIYSARISGGKMRASSEGQPRWLSEDDIPARLAPVAREIFDAYLAHQTRLSPPKDACPNN